MQSSDGLKTKRSSAPGRGYLVDRRSRHFVDGASALLAAAAVYLILAAPFVPDQASFDLGRIVPGFFRHPRRILLRTSNLMPC